MTSLEETAQAQGADSTISTTSSAPGVPLPNTSSVPPSSQPYDVKRVVIFAIVIAIIVTVIATLAIMHISQPSAPAMPPSSTVPGAPALGAPAIGSPAAMSDVDTYKIVYALRSESLSALGSTTQIYAGEFRKKQNQKVVTEMTSGGSQFTSTTYNLNGLIVECSSGLFDDEVECQVEDGRTDSILALDSEEAFQTVNGMVAVPANAQKQGVATIAGRTCEQYSFTVTNTTIGQPPTLSLLFYLAAESDSGDDGSPVRIVIDACTDEDTGLFLSLNASMNQHSSLTGLDTLVPLISYEAISYTETVDDSEFIPLQRVLVASAGCDETNAVAILTPLATGQYRVNITESTQERFDAERTVIFAKDFGTMSLERGKALPLSFASTQKNPDAYSRSYEVCVGEDCRDVTCYPERTDDSASTAGKGCFMAATDKTACEAKDGCVYQEPLCTEFSCSIERTADACNSHNDCGWQSYGKSGYCSERYCSEYSTPESCEKNTGCDWNGGCTYASLYDTSNTYEVTVAEPALDKNEAQPTNVARFQISGTINRVQATGSSAVAYGDPFTIELAYDLDQNAKEVSDGAQWKSQSYQYRGEGASRMTIDLASTQWNLTGKDSKLEIVVTDTKNSSYGMPSSYRVIQSRNGNYVEVSLLFTQGAPAMQLPSSLSIGNFLNPEIMMAYYGEEGMIPDRSLYVYGTITDITPLSMP